MKSRTDRNVCPRVKIRTPVRNPSENRSKESQPRARAILPRAKSRHLADLHRLGWPRVVLQPVPPGWRANEFRRRNPWPGGIPERTELRFRWASFRTDHLAAIALPAGRNPRTKPGPCAVLHGARLRAWHTVCHPPGADYESKPTASRSCTVQESGCGTRCATLVGDAADGDHEMPPAGIRSESGMDAQAGASSERFSLAWHPVILGGWGRVFETPERRSRGPRRTFNLPGRRRLRPSHPDRGRSIRYCPIVGKALKKQWNGCSAR
jgi:hypothetical protein